MRLWLSFLVLLCATFGIDFEALTITQLRIPKTDGRVEATTPLIVCYTGGSNPYISAILTAIDMTHAEDGPIIEWQTQTNVPPQDGCFKFEVLDITSLEEPLPLKLILETMADDMIPIGHGIADVMMPSKDELPKPITVDVIGQSDKDKAIRVNENLGSKVFTIGDDDNSCPMTISGKNGETSGPPCYYMDVPKAKTTFDLCLPDIGTGVKFCSDVETNLVETPEHDENTDSTTNTVTFDRIKKQISLHATCMMTDAKAEMVIQTGGDTLKICKLELIGDNCQLASITPSATYDIFIAYTDKSRKSAVSYDKTTVKDRDLQGNPLRADVLEAYWNFDKTTESYFELKREPAESYFAVVNVDCSHMTTTVCYWYFTGLKPNKYTLTLGRIVDWSASTITTFPDQEMIEVTMPNSGGKSTFYMEEIQVEDIQVIQEDDEKVAKFSFRYNHEITNKTAQYEIILINKKGNWKRSTMKTEIDDKHDCSTAIDFPLEQLGEDSELKMLVVARDINTGKVLASGEKMLQISAQKVVGPELDNSNEGYISTLAIVGAAIGGVACLMALVIAAIMFVKRRHVNDGLEYPLQRSTVENSDIILGHDNLTTL